MNRLLLVFGLSALTLGLSCAQSVNPNGVNQFGDYVTFDGCRNHTSINNGATTTLKAGAGRYCGFVVTTAIVTTALGCFDNASALSGTEIEVIPTLQGVGAHPGNSAPPDPRPFTNGLTCGAASGTGAVTIFWQ